MAQVENSLSTDSGEAASSGNGNNNPSLLISPTTVTEQQQQQQPPAKKKRNQPGMPDPEAEVVALSPKTLLATNRFVCEICGKGFQRDQNLQLHRRGHNLPWKLRQRGPKEAVKKRAYVCPELNCVHHDPRRALGDLTGIKKHFCRKHGEKKWKCDRCSKKYAVQSDWKAHLKTCGTREYKCDCGTLFSRRDSFVTHRAFCDALAQESAKVQTATDSPPATTTSSAVVSPVLSINQSSEMQENTIGVTTSLSSAGCSPSSTSNCNGNSNGNRNGNIVFDSRMFAPLSRLSPPISQPQSSFPSLVTTVPNSDPSNTYSIEPPPALSLSPLYQFPRSAASPLFRAQEHEGGQYSAAVQQPSMSATALLQKAAQMGAASSGSSLLCGFGLTAAASSPPPHPDQDKAVKPENASAVADELGLGLPSSSDFGGSGPMIDDPSGFFGSKPMTLDLLGLGIGPENSSTGAFPAYLTSIGGHLDVATAFRAGNNSQLKGPWDGQAAQRKPNETVL